MTDHGKTKELFASEAELKNVLLHIQQDCAEKLEEIEVKSDEEFEAEKYKEILNQVHFIELYYAQKENLVKKKNMVDIITMKNEARMNHVTWRHSIIRDIIEEVKIRLHDETGITKYRTLFSMLLLEGLLKMLESKVKIWCRESDVPLAYDVSKYVGKKFTEMTGIKVSLTIEKERSIDDKDTGGGVILVSGDDKISLNNTMFSRVERLSFLLQPAIYIKIFKKKRKKLLPKQSFYDWELKEQSLSAITLL